MARHLPWLWKVVVVMCWAVWACSLEVDAVVLHVAPKDAGDADCSNVANACTLQAAASRVVAGTANVTILLSPGEYRNHSCRLSFVVLTSFTMQATQSGMCVLCETMVD